LVPLILLVALFGILRVLGYAGIPVAFGTWSALRIALAGMFLLTASAHWGKRRADLIRMVPPVFPQPEVLVTITGILEILGALGLLLPATARYAALALALMLVESLPLTIKLFSKRGEYDVTAELVENENTLSASESSKARKANVTQTAAASGQLKTEILNRVLKATTSGDYSGLIEDEKMLARQMRAEALRDLSQTLAGARASEDRLPSEPASVTVINREEESEAPFTIVFQARRESLTGKDLIFALKGLNRQSGRTSESGIPLGEYKITNESDESIQPEMPLFAQLGSGNRVFLSPLFEPTVSEMEN